MTIIKIKIIINMINKYLSQFINFLNIIIRKNKLKTTFFKIRKLKLFNKLNGYV